jgi:hypothetical protein
MHIRCGKAQSSPRVHQWRSEFSTDNPQELRVLESPIRRLVTRRFAFSHPLRVEAVGKKGSQDSSTCDINTKRRLVQREFITSYDVLDSFPQLLST